MTTPAVQGVIWDDRRKYLIIKTGWISDEADVGVFLDTSGTPIGGTKIASFRNPGGATTYLTYQLAEPPTSFYIRRVVASTLDPVEGSEYSAEVVIDQTPDISSANLWLYYHSDASGNWLGIQMVSFQQTTWGTMTVIDSSDNVVASSVSGDAFFFTNSLFFTDVYYWLPYTGETPTEATEFTIRMSNPYGTSDKITTAVSFDQNTISEFHLTVKNNAMTAYSLTDSTAQNRRIFNSLGLVLEFGDVSSQSDFPGIAGFHPDFGPIAAMPVPTKGKPFFDISYNYEGLRHSSDGLTVQGFYSPVQSVYTSSDFMPSARIIGPGAFENATELTAIDLIDIETVGTDAFRGCVNLASVTHNGLLQHLHANCFRESGLTEFTLSTSNGLPLDVSNYAFADCTSLVNTGLAPVATLGDYVYSGCSALDEAGIQGDFTSAVGTFRNCAALRRAQLSSTITSLAGTFEGCTSLNVTVPSAVQQLTADTFKGVAGTANLLLPATVDWVSANAFSGALIPKYYWQGPPPSTWSSTQDTSGTYYVYPRHLTAWQGITLPANHTLTTWTDITGATRVSEDRIVVTAPYFYSDRTVDVLDASTNEPLSLTAGAIVGSRQLIELDGAIDTTAVLAGGLFVDPSGEPVLIEDDFVGAELTATAVLDLSSSLITVSLDGSANVTHWDVLISGGYSDAPLYLLLPDTVLSFADGTPISFTLPSLDRKWLLVPRNGDRFSQIVPVSVSLNPQTLSVWLQAQLTAAEPDAGELPPGMSFLKDALNALSQMFGGQAVFVRTSLNTEFENLVADISSEYLVNKDIYAIAIPDGGSLTITPAQLGVGQNRFLYLATPTVADTGAGGELVGGEGAGGEGAGGEGAGGEGAGGEGTGGELVGDEVGQTLLSYIIDVSGDISYNIVFDEMLVVNGISYGLGDVIPIAGGSFRLLARGSALLEDITMAAPQIVSIVSNSAGTVVVVDVNDISGEREYQLYDASDTEVLPAWTTFQRVFLATRTLDYYHAPEIIDLSGSIYMKARHPVTETESDPSAPFSVLTLPLPPTQATIVNYTSSNTIQIGNGTAGANYYVLDLSQNFLSSPSTYTDPSAYLVEEDASGAWSAPALVDVILDNGPVPCFLADAPVLTPRGYRRMDALRIGDLVVTGDGRHVPIQRVLVHRVPTGRATNPYVIPKGQFGARRRILISPRHRVVVPGRGLVEARLLGLKQDAMEGEESIEYYNLELPDWRSDNMIVGGVEVESLAPVARYRVSPAVFREFLRRRFGVGYSEACRAFIQKKCVFHTDGTVELPLWRNYPTVKHT